VGGRWGGRRGAAVIEASFLLPWLFFLFIGAVDAGFELYGLVTVENATRSAALWASQSTTNANGAGSPATACTNYVLPALKLLGNVPSSATCTTGTSLSSLAVTATNPVALTMTSPTTIPDGTTVSAVTVTVWYLTPQLCPIPGVFSGQTTIKRAVTMRIQQ
jgi:Flp pilus assembly protein TadG